MYIKNPEKFRCNIKNKLNEKLNNENASLNLEKGIYNYTIKEAEKYKILKKWENKLFVEIYLNHLRTILFNLTDNWVQEINNGTIQSHKLAFMTHQELNHDKWNKLIELKSIRDKNKFEINMAAATDTFTCKKCKGKNCTYYLQQIRSADEPMTIFVTCCDCGNRWKTS